MTDEEEELMLMRLADGELPPAEAAALRARIAAEPALAARYALFARSREVLAGAFAPVAAEPVPARLIAALRGAAPAAQVVALRRRPARWLPLALAASLAALLAAPVGWLLGRQQGQEAALADPLAGARAAIAQALETLPSGSVREAAGRMVRPLATHLASGLVCRDFALEGPGGAALGLACREEGAWRLRASVTLQGEAALRPAGADHPVLAAALERRGAEPPLDAEREAALLARGWR